MPIVTFSIAVLAFREGYQAVESTGEEGEICVLHAKDGSLCLRGTEILDILLRIKKK